MSELQRVITQILANNIPSRIKQDVNLAYFDPASQNKLRSPQDIALDRNPPSGDIYSALFTIDDFVRPRSIGGGLSTTHGTLASTQAQTALSLRGDKHTGVFSVNIGSIEAPDGNISTSALNESLSRLERVVPVLKERGVIPVVSLSLEYNIKNPYPSDSLSLEQRKSLIEQLSYKESLFAPRQLSSLGEYYQRIQNLQQQGVQFVVAAGNSGPGQINALALPVGLNVAGALNEDGNIAPYSNRALVGTYTDGTIIPRLAKLPDGRVVGDLNPEDGQNIGEVVGGEPPQELKQLLGKSINPSNLANQEEVTASANMLLAEKAGLQPTNRDFNLLRGAQNKLIPIQTAVARGLIDAAVIEQLPTADRNAYVTTDGEWLIPVVRSNDTESVRDILPLQRIIRGTSFAAPVYAAELASRLAEQQRARLNIFS